MRGMDLFNQLVLLYSDVQGLMKHVSMTLLYIFSIWTFFLYKATFTFIYTYLLFNIDVLYCYIYIYEFVNYVLYI